MASNGNSTGDLFLSLGLDINDLETGFVAAENTVRENLSRLNRESNLIRLRAQVEIGNLDEAADAAQILTIRETALNQQMAIQRDRISLAEAALNELIQRHGEEATITQRAAAALERERLSLQNLERELRELQDTADDADESLGAVSDVFGELPAKMATATATVLAFGAGLMQAAEAGAALVEKFRELQTQSYELNLPVEDTKNLLRQLNLGGGDIGDFEGYIRGISDAYVKGEYDDPEFIALRKYGAEVVDATGKLKNFKDLTEEVYQAWKKADAAGEGIEFLQLTGGEAGVRDAIQFFQRYEEAKEDASKVFNSGVDPAELHEAERSLNLMTEQFGELKDALTDIFTPFLKESAESFFELFHTSTEYLVGNKENLQSWGFIAEEVLSTAKGHIDELITKFASLDESLEGNSLYDAFKKTASDFGESFLLGTPTKILKDWGAFDGILERAKENQTANERINDYKKALAEEEAFQAEIKALEAMPDKNPLNQYDWKRINALREELEDLEIESDFGDDPYSKAIAENDLWLERELKQKNFLSTDEEIALRELHAAKAEQIEQEKEDRIAEIRKAANAELQSDLQNKFDKIEEEKEKRINAGMEEAEATILAERQKAQALKSIETEITEEIQQVWGTELEKQMAQIEKKKQAWIKAGVDETYATQLAEAEKAQAMKNFENEVVSQVNSIWQTELQNRLDQIEKEKQAWIQKGVDEVKATAAAEKAKADARRQAAMDVLKRQAEEYKIYKEQGYGGLLAHKYAELEEAGIDPNDLKMTPQQLENFQRANKIAESSLMPNFMTDEERAESRRMLNNWINDYKNDPSNYIEIDGKRYLDTYKESVVSQKETKDAIETRSYNPTEFYQVQSANLGPSMEQLNSAMTNVSQNYSELSQRLADLNATITDFSGNQPTAYASDGYGQTQQQQTQPINSNISVNIQEAHAWDSEHIQELAEKVADKITPEIESALNSANSY